MWDFSLILLTLFLATFLGIVIYARWNYGSLEKLGIPVVPPHWLLGSQPNMHNIVLQDDDVQNAFKFGKTWGIYEGRNPRILTIDTQLIRSIFIKDFNSHFMNRRTEGFGDKLLDEAVDTVHGEKWKMIRAHLSPTFTTSRMKVMSEQIGQCVKDFMADLQIHFDEKKTGNKAVFDMKRIFSALEMDIVAQCGFGVKISSIREPNNEFMKQAHLLAMSDSGSSWIITLLVSFPILTKCFNLINQSAVGYFKKVFNEIMAQRRAAPGGARDFLDLLSDMSAKIGTPEFDAHSVTLDTLLAQSVIFIFAGFETSSYTLTNIAYYLATHTDVQVRLQAEVDSVLAKYDGRVDHETIQELPYLSAVINETLRLSPTILRLERCCTQDWTHPETGFQVKKGQLVQVPLWALQRHPDYFEDPLDFRPDRFLDPTKRVDQCAHIPFGTGPRNCIAMRFALESLKLSMMHLIKDFEFERTPETRLKLKPGMLFVSQYEPIYLNMTRRQNK